MKRCINVIITDDCLIENIAGNFAAKLLLRRLQFDSNCFVIIQ